MKKISTLIAFVAFAFVASVTFSSPATAASNQWSSMGGGMTSYSGFNGHNGSSGSSGGFYSGAGSHTNMGNTIAEGQGSIRAGSSGSGLSSLRSNTTVFSNANLNHHGARSNSGVGVNSTTVSRGSVTGTNIVSGSAGSAAFRRWHHM